MAALPDSLFDGPPISARPAEQPARQVRNRQAGSSATTTRRDIQGLRALAVVLVILDHLVNWPRGGFIGVDVFFVVSGFLITGILIRSGEQNKAQVHRFFGRFYWRRIRRILPAAMLVLIVVWFAADIAYKGTRVSDNHTDELWAAAFLANYHFAHVGTDYFAANNAPSLVQHFWSLAVEEQFYLLWPIVVFLIVGLFARRTKLASRLTVLLPVVCLATVASFVWGLHATRENAANAYFATPARAWELGVGAVLAVLVARFPRLQDGIGGRYRGVLAFTGLVVIVTSAFLITQSSSFPVPTADLPVLGAALIIAASASDSRWISPLTNRGGQWLGDLSYSLYLWHWPVILLMLVAMPYDHGLRYFATVAVILGVSLLSYVLVEQPIHEGRRTDEKSMWHVELTRPRLALVGVACLAIGVAGAAARSPAPVPAFQAASVDPGSAKAAKPPSDAAVPSASLGASLKQSLNAGSWPDLSPSLSNLTTHDAQASWGSCRGGHGCSFGSGPKTAVVLGDSIAMAWMPTLRAALGPKWTIYGYTLEECPAADVSVNNQQQPPQHLTACDTEHAHWIKRALARDPDVVFLATAENVMARLRDTSDQAYERGMVKTITALRPGRNRTIVTLSPPPATVALADCDVAGSSPSNCVKTPKSSWYEQSAAERAAVRKTGTAYIDTTRLFCVDDADGVFCPSFVGQTPVRFDANHLTTQFARRIGPDMAASLKRIAKVN